MSARLAPRLLGVVLALQGAVTILPAQQVRVTHRDTIVRRDTMTLRVLPADAEKLRTQVMTLRAREQRLFTELRAKPEVDTPERRRLLEELTLVARQSFELMSVVESRCASERRPRPEGYLGIHIEGNGERFADGRIQVRAMVSSLDPGSPAQRAGVLPGDRMVAIAARDFTANLPSIDDLLIVGKRIAVRVNRDGKVRDFNLEVEKRPESFGQSCAEFERLLMPLRMSGPERIAFEARLPERRPFTDPTRVVQSIRGGEGGPDEMRIVVFAPSASGVTSIAFYAGAELRPLDDDWRAVLGLKPQTPGVIVSAVAPGSPAAQAGLRNGDVVTLVGKSPATSPEVVVRLLGMSDSDETSLTVMRGGERKSLTLKWGAR